MRLCRVKQDTKPQVGFYAEDKIVLAPAAAKAYTQATQEQLVIPAGDNLLDFLPPDGPGFAATKKLGDWLATNPASLPATAIVPASTAEVLVPVPKPNKIFLLAGNYADHIKEGGGIAAERAETFPYVFMKPPTTTLTDPGKAIKIPKISPATIDWELELAVVIGKTAKHVKEADALKYVAGYTVINDISNRKFKPNAQRKARDKDSFFDWLHGKWFDSFCPCGPCVASADAIPDPQTLPIQLRLNGEVKQNSNTAMQIFPVAAVIEFLSGIVTLEPGDLISTGTPSGVGNATGTYLKPGDVMHATINGIGTLVTPVVAE